MYSFAQRRDTTVVDEPLYAWYLSQSSVAEKHPGYEEVLQSQDQNGERVIRQMVYGAYPSAEVVFKQMTHHLLDLPLDFLDACKNVMLIRDPRAILQSYSKVIEQPQLTDIGIPQQEMLFNKLKQRNLLHAVVDAAELLKNPRGVLENLCYKLGIDWQESMLGWEAGPKPYDGVWAPHWYANVHSSTGFAPNAPKPIVLEDGLQALADEALPFYSKWYAEAIKAV
jgi:hypothetical protein